MSSKLVLFNPSSDPMDEEPSLLEQVHGALEALREPLPVSVSGVSAWTIRLDRGDDDSPEGDLIVDLIEFHGFIGGVDVEYGSEHYFVWERVGEYSWVNGEGEWFAPAGKALEVRVYFLSMMPGIKRLRLAVDKWTFSLEFDGCKLCNIPLQATGNVLSADFRVSL